MTGYILSSTPGTGHRITRPAEEKEVAFKVLQSWSKQCRTQEGEEGELGQAPEREKSTTVSSSQRQIWKIPQNGLWRESNKM